MMMTSDSFRIAAVVAACAAASICRAQDAALTKERVAGLQAAHRGKAGLYLRPGVAARSNHRDLYLTHPLLDAVILSASWRDIEPQKGRYAFDALRAEVDVWGNAGKGVVVCVALYGQAVNDRQTPPWIYDEPGVRTLSFLGGGTARGRRIRIPAVWDKGFVETYVEPMVRRFAQQFDGDRHVWYVMPGFGHIGNLTCQPSKDGARACLEAGWTPEAWKDYCRRVMGVYRRHFQKTPVFLKAAGMFLRDRRHDNYRNDCGELLVEFGNQGACVVHFGLEADRSEMQDVYRHLAPLLPAVQRGISRIGLGDDWPLWVPEDRRSDGPTRNHDEENLRRTLENAFVAADGTTEIPTTVLFCQQPEILASHPGADDYRPAVADALRRARQRLKENDRLAVPEPRHASSTGGVGTRALPSPRGDHSPSPGCLPAAPY